MVTVKEIKKADLIIRAFKEFEIRVEFFSKS
jgi:hypothetical protein